MIAKHQNSSFSHLMGKGDEEGSYSILQWLLSPEQGQGGYPTQTRAV